MKQDKYVTYAELTQLLEEYAAKYPQYMDLAVAGKSYEGRNVYAVTITNKETGAHDTKPAMLVNACIHAGEVTGTQVALHLIDRLLTGAGNDAYIDRILDKRTYYILPRSNPDGAERFITTEFESWGNLRPFLMDPEVQGLDRADVDGNGLLLLMRKKDDNGEWKISEKDSRLMIAREAWEYGGEYYSIYPEGVLVGDQVDVDDFKVLPRKFQLNMNRNYPDGWNIQTGISEGGAYPLSEPETFAVGTWIMNHPNIGTLNDLHTNAGCLIRPYSYQGDEFMPMMDRELYDQFGQMGKKETGYDLVSCFDAFTYPGEPVRRGCLDDWAYESYGILGVTTELWDMAGKAGVGKAEGNYYPDQPKTEEEELQMLRFNDEQLDGKNFINWTEFDHPQLGKVEIGGWNWKWSDKNPPIKFLFEECEKVTNMLVKQSNFLPELCLKNAKVEKLADQLYKIDVTVENAGFMPTYLMVQSVKNRVDQPIEMELQVTDDMTMIKGRALQTLGHAQGRIRRDRNFYFGEPGEDVPKKTVTGSWIIRCANPCTAVIKVMSTKGGSFDVNVELN